jgi:hypothetical protein
MIIIFLSSTEREREREREEKIGGGSKRHCIWGGGRENNIFYL